MSERYYPFSDESHAVTVGNLTLENRTDRISIFGDVDITRDAPGLALAMELKTRIDHIVAALQAVAPLPQAVTTKPPGTARNPFKAGD